LIISSELTFSIEPRRHDRDDVKLVLLYNTSHLGRETKWSTFDEPTGEDRRSMVMPAFLATATAVGVSRVGSD
jgi:hypothetical protein